MRSWIVFILIVLSLACECTSAGQTLNFPTNAPAKIELRDQFNAPQDLSFPTTNITILTIADRKGSEEVDAWIAALKPLYCGRVDFRGLANVESVPRLLQAHVRRKFQEKHKYPVMLDWSGAACQRFGLVPGLVNILVIDRAGEIRARATGRPSPATLTGVQAALDAALSATQTKGP